MCQLPSQADLSSLGGCVRLNSRQADTEPGAAGNVDNASPLGLLHAGRHSLGKIESASYIGIENAVPVALGNVFERLADLTSNAPCIVHQHMYRRMGSFCLFDELEHGSPVADVEAPHFAPAKLLGLCKTGLIEVASPDLRAGVRKGLGDGSAESVRCPRHNHGLTGKLDVHVAKTPVNSSKFSCPRDADRLQCRRSGLACRHQFSSMMARVS